MAKDVVENGSAQMYEADASSGHSVSCQGTAGIVQFDAGNGDFHFNAAQTSWINRCLPSGLPPAQIRKDQIVGATLESATSFKVWYCRSTQPKAANPKWKLETTRPFECSSQSTAESLVTQIRQVACWWGREQPPCAVILVNPTSGKLKAKAMWRQVVQPVLAGAAGWDVKCIETQRPGHATELVEGLDVGGVDLLLFLGGDGTLYEGIQGLLKRPDWKTASQLPIGHIPGGTGNGVATSAGLWDGMAAVRAVCKGCTRPLDVASVLQAPASRQYVALSAVYGIVSNLEVGTDHLRWMGDARFTYGAIREVFKGRRHPCRAAWLPAGPQYEPPTSSSAPPPPLDAPRRGLTISSFPPGPDLPLLSSLEAFQGGELTEQAPGTPQDAPPGWRVLGEEGLRGVELFTLANVPYLSSSYHCNPQGAMDSGHMDLSWGSPDTRGQSLQTLMASETGRHLQQPWIHSDTVRAMVLEPIGDSSHLRLDGEVVPQRTLYLEVHPGLCTMLVAP